MSRAMCTCYINISPPIQTTTHRRRSLLDLLEATVSFCRIRWLQCLCEWTTGGVRNTEKNPFLLVNVCFFQFCYATSMSPHNLFFLERLIVFCLLCFFVFSPSDAFFFFLVSYWNSPGLFLCRSPNLLKKFMAPICAPSWLSPAKSPSFEDLQWTRPHEAKKMFLCTWTVHNSQSSGKKHVVMKNCINLARMPSPNHNQSSQMDFSKTISHTSTSDGYIQLHSNLAMFEDISSAWRTAGPRTLQNSKKSMTLGCLCCLVFRSPLSLPTVSSPFQTMKPTWD